MCQVKQRRKPPIIGLGLGYVGLPVAVAFARAGFDVIGFDIDRERIAELCRGEDRTREIDAADLDLTGLRLSFQTEDLRAADFFIVTVPTPIDRAFTPDLSFLLAASRTVGRAIKPGDIVVYESTVYPGSTGLAHAQFADATCGTIRLKLLKIGVLVTTSVRREMNRAGYAGGWFS